MGHNLFDENYQKFILDFVFKNEKFNYYLNDSVLYQELMSIFFQVVDMTSYQSSLTIQLNLTAGYLEESLLMNYFPWN